MAGKEMAAKDVYIFFGPLIILYAPLSLKHRFSGFKVGYVERINIITLILEREQIKLPSSLLSYHAMKMCGGWRYRSIYTQRWIWIDLTFLLLYPRGKIPRDPVDTRLGGPLSWAGRCGEGKILLPLPGIEPRPSSQ
jgi:hypothetical protein